MNRKPAVYPVVMVGLGGEGHVELSFLAALMRCETVRPG
jgi:hypothetical protein